MELLAPDYRGTKPPRPLPHARHGQGGRQAQPGHGGERTHNGVRRLRRGRNHGGGAGVPLSAELLFGNRLLHPHALRRGLRHIAPHHRHGGRAGCEAHHHSGLRHQGQRRNSLRQRAGHRLHNLRPPCAGRRAAAGRGHTQPQARRLHLPVPPPQRLRRGLQVHAGLQHQQRHRYGRTGGDARPCGRKYRGRHRAHGGRKPRHGLRRPQAPQLQPTWACAP